MLGSKKGGALWAPAFCVYFLGSTGSSDYDGVMTWVATYAPSELLFRFVWVFLCSGCYYGSVH